ncbi:DUF1501 domain-containing protein [Paraliomyxa miuraensis]|uniref:DUF1501 domain-containing protein n=1 Tax=Paraliomyxa miuraensis TaxID=376150 RepID=UPI00224F950E|nr:DUF1501 domain-containing protein [Paraliomyxa miuraensis]MCX4240492.1 DUF1501 domain-containing protein [Paraliomyxa miuraensis]
MNISRRNMLKTALFGSGFVGLRSMVTGIPIAALIGGRIDDAMAEDITEEPQSLVLFTSQAGDPFNANTPGCYGVSGVYNNPAASMAPTQMMLGDVQTTAAKPWAEVPQRFLDRTTFIHHRTYFNTHPAYTKVLTLAGSAKSAGGNGADQIGSVLSSELAPLVDTLQSEPLALSNAELSFQGRALQSLRPSMLRQMFAPLGGVELDLQLLRDQTLDDMNVLLKEQGTHAQRAWLDRHALSREQVRAIDETLLERFAMLEDDSPMNQVRAAVTLILMKVTPVIAIQIPFGGDNHKDAGLVKERDETISGVATWQFLLEELETAGLQDKVTVANLNVFGRTLRNQGGSKGRDHNLNHHVMSICGKHVKAGVVGGIEPSGNDYGAMSIDSVTGQGVPGDMGDIVRDLTLQSAAHTLGRVLGLPQERLDERIEGGTPILSAIGGL